MWTKQFCCWWWPRPKSYIKFVLMCGVEEPEEKQLLSCSEKRLKNRCDFSACKRIFPLFNARQQQAMPFMNPFIHCYCLLTTTSNRWTVRRAFRSSVCRKETSWTWGTHNQADAGFTWSSYSQNAAKSHPSWSWPTENGAAKHRADQGCGVGSPVIRLRLREISIIRLRLQLRLRLRLRTDSDLQQY